MIPPEIKPFTRLDLALVFIIYASLAVLLACTFSDFGLTWDEPLYFRVSGGYFQWLIHPAWGAVDSVWELNNEHPPLHKILGGMTEWIFHTLTGWASPSTAFRMSNLIFLFPLVSSLYWLGFQVESRFVAISSPIVLILLPRVFFQAHLLSLDFSSMTMWTLGAAVLWRFQVSGGSILPSGIATGAALATKLNAPLFLLSWPFFWFLNKLKFTRPVIRKEIIRGLQVIGVALLTFYVAWPWLWRMPVTRLVPFLFFHLDHFAIPVSYFGTLTYSAPWHYPYVMFFLTTPLIITIFYGYGLFQAVKAGKAGMIFILLQSWLPLLLVQLSSAKYDGVRLFLPAFPFIALTACSGLESLLKKVPKRMGNQTFVPPLAGILLIASLVLSNRSVYPYADSYFSEVIGGSVGAARKGFDLDTWCDAYHGAIPFFTSHEPSRFWFEGCSHIPPAEYKLGMSPVDHSSTAGPKDADYWVYLNSREGIEKIRAMKGVAPEFTVQADGAPLLLIFRRPR
jgi:4-amino-4-deoxy-L-arabinose transferase-like glycosyltransferase